MRVRRAAMVLGIVAFVAGAVVAGIGEASQHSGVLGSGVLVAAIGIGIVAVTLDRNARDADVRAQRRDRLTQNLQTLFEDDRTSRDRRDDREL